MKYFLITTLFLTLCHCSIKSPEFTITGQKTALEQQVLGSYQHLTDNAIVTTSMRTGGDGEGLDSPQKQAILQAVQNQRFNKDEIDEFKREKVIGENNRGYLQVRPTPRYEQDESYKKLVDVLVEEENGNRRVIYQRVLVMTEVAQEEEINAIFANMQIDQSAPGTLIQQRDGQWLEKSDNRK
ncbi:DUF1318 domain-containing protein [candidate division KSB1 bacterium]|nr:DUF1318 domain-containing protein [candidate division KSB1 bacterium]